MMQSKAGTVGSGQLAAEDGGATWQWPAAPAPGLGLASNGPSPARRSMSMVEREAGGR